MKDFLYILLLAYVGSLSCGNENERSPSSSGSMGKYEHLASDFSHGSNFLLLNILDTQRRETFTIVVQNHYLRNTLKRTIKDEHEYIKLISTVLKNNHTLSLDSTASSFLASHRVSQNVRQLSDTSENAKLSFINKFFQKNQFGEYVHCFDEENEYQVIYTLIKEWSLLVRTDDESGCIIINALENDLKQVNL